MATPGPAIRFEHVTKRFPGVLALDDVSFDVAAGSCHALCGENGAGKSTLGKILGGIHPPDGGRVVVFGEPSASRARSRRSPRASAIVHQELAFCENLSVAENLCLGIASAHAARFVSRAAMRRRATEMLGAIGAVDRRRPPRRRAEHRAAADAADRRRGRAAARGSSSSTSRPAACRSTRPNGSTALIGDAAASAASRSSTSATGWTRSSGCATPSRSSGMAATSSTQPAAALDRGNARRGDDRPPAGRLLSKAPARRLPARSCCGSRTSSSPSRLPGRVVLAPCRRGRRPRRTRRRGPIGGRPRALRPRPRRHRPGLDRRSCTGFRRSPVDAMRRRHRARARGPQAAGTDPVDVGARQHDAADAGGAVAR